MALSFSNYSGGNPAPAPPTAQAHTAPAQAGGRRRRGKRTAKKCSKKMFVWRGGEGEEKEEEEGEIKGSGPGSKGGKRKRRKSARKSRKSKKFFGLF